MKSNIEFTMVLRSSGDTDFFDTEAITLQYLLEVYNIPIPAKLPIAVEPRYDLPEVPQE